MTWNSHLPHCDTCTCQRIDPSCRRCGTAITDQQDTTTGGFCAACCRDAVSRHRQAEWDDAERKHRERTAAGKPVCVTHCADDQRWCRGTPLVGTSLCYSHADDDLRFAAAYGQHLGAMAVNDTDAELLRVHTPHPNVVDANRRVTVFHERTKLERARIRQERAELITDLTPHPFNPEDSVDNTR